MENVGNYTEQQARNFPLDAEGLEAIQKNIAACELIGMIAGNKAIIAGCKPNEGGTVRSPGWVWLKTVKCPDGELLPWIGGNTTEGMYVKSTAVEVEAEGYKYPQAYTERCLAPGIGEENFKWIDFHVTTTTLELRHITDAHSSEIAAIKGVPTGVIEMYAGTVAPADYLLCDGCSVAIADYPLLYKAIGGAFNTAPLWNGVANSVPASGYFNLPDLRGRFIVGVNNLESDYSSIAKCGGTKKHTLTVDEMPAHGHSYSAPLTPDDHPGGKDGYARPNGLESGNTGNAGGGQAHENRPPYYALAYIIKAK